MTKQQKVKIKISKLEKQTFNSDDHNESPPLDIFAYNDLRSCADLFRMHGKGSLDLQPDFQRDIVWSQPARSRFIDSLIKELPIPNLCFAYESKKERWTVIDGLQRISTIVDFLKGDDFKLSQIDDIEPKIAGKTAAELKNAKDGLAKLFEKVENTTIPVTVIRCDLTKTQHMEYLFTIFHRLNTGGMKLNNQEIRNCISSGTFNELLHELDENSTWRQINKMSPGKKYRYAKQEILLRMFAFNAKYKNYDGKLSKFLNDYMHNNRNPSTNFLTEKRELFERTIKIVGEKVFDKSNPKTQISVLEALLVGVSKNIDKLEDEDKNSIQIRYKKMLSDNSFSDGELKEGLSQKAKVLSRMEAAINSFS